MHKIALTSVSSLEVPTGTATTNAGGTSYGKPLALLCLCLQQGWLSPTVKPQAVSTAVLVVRLAVSGSQLVSPTVNPYTVGLFRRRNVITHTGQR